MILDPEIIKRDRAAAHNRNPNKERIEYIDAQLKDLYTERAQLLSEDEKYLNLLGALANTPCLEPVVAAMSDQELGEHFGDAWCEYIPDSPMATAIMLEVMKRIGYRFEEET